MEETVKLDGWVNFFSGLGTTLDPKTKTSFQRSIKISDDELNSLYRFDGLGKKIVNRIPYDMTREGFEIVGDTDNLISDKLRELEAQKHFRIALQWARLYGGSIMVIGVSDGTENFLEPLNEDRIDTIDFLRVYDRSQIEIKTDDLYQNPIEEKYGEPEYYNIHPYHGTESFKVHETRVLRFDGEEIPDRELQRNDYWNDSIFQGIYERLRGLGTVYSGIEQIINEFTIAKLTIDNLTSLLDNGKEALIKKRLDILGYSRNLLNTIVLDKEEEFDRINAQVSGLQDIITKVERVLCSMTGYPPSILFSDFPKGLTSGSNISGETRLYYDDVSSAQNNDLQYPSERLIELIMLSKQGPTNGQELEEWSIKFNPLWQPTQKEIAETRKIQSETDKNYVEMQSLSPDEVAVSRFSGDEYSYETQLSESHIKEIEERDKIGNTVVMEGGILEEDEEVN